MTAGELDAKFSDLASKAIDRQARAAVCGNRRKLDRADSLEELSHLLTTPLAV